MILDKEKKDKKIGNDYIILDDDNDMISYHAF